MGHYAKDKGDWPPANWCTPGATDNLKKSVLEACVEIEGFLQKNDSVLRQSPEGKKFLGFAKAYLAPFQKEEAFDGKGEYFRTLANRYDQWISRFWSDGGISNIAKNAPDTVQNAHYWLFNELRGSGSAWTAGKVVLAMKTMGDWYQRTQLWEQKHKIRYH